MSEYPESSFPWTHYFQGVVMPKWSNCWYLQPVADSRVDWYVDQVHGRLDHVGSIESEESEIFLIAAQQVLLQAIDRREEFLRDLQYSEEEREVIYDGLVSGLQQAITISEGQEVVFWTSGYESDQEKLNEAIRRFQLGKQHPDYYHPPHRERRRKDRLFDLNWQRKELRQRLMTSGPDKSLKRFIHGLKDRP